MEPASKPNTAHALASLIAAFKSQNLPANLKKQSSISLKKSLNYKWWIDEIINFRGYRFPSSDKAVLEAFKAQIEEYSKQNPLNASLLYGFTNPRTILTVGDQLITIDSLNEVFGDARDAKVEHKAGEIIFIGVWTSWCETSKELMQLSKEIKEKYGAKLGDKVRIICISLDNTKQDAIEAIKEMEWRNLEHYHVEGYEHNFRKNYGVQFIPHAMLINQNGEIVWMGHPGEEKVKEKIENLLEKQGESGIPRAAYKKLKSLMKNDFIKDRLDKNEGKFYFELKLNKTVYYDESGKKSRVEYERPTLEGGCTTKKEKIFREVVNLFTNNFKEDVLKLNLDIEDKSADITEALKILSSALESVNLPGIEVDIIKETYFGIRDGQIELNSKKKFVQRANITPNAENIKKISALNNSWIEFLAKASPRQQDWLKCFRPNYSVNVGDAFQEFDVEDAYSDEKSILRHEKGEVLLVTFWAKWIVACQGTMNHNQEMLEKNKEAWGDKVRIVGVSRDDSKEDLLKQVNERKWTSMKHFFIGLDTTKSHPGLIIYGAIAIPHLVLVDQAGKIAFNGHPRSCKIEKEIQNLLESKPIGGEGQDKTNDREAQVPFEVGSKVKKALSDSFQKEITQLIKAINYFPSFSGSLKQIKTFSTESLSIVKQISAKPQITLEFREPDLPAFQKITENLKQVAGEGNLVVTLKAHKLVNLEFGTVCNSCQAALTPEQPQFFCYSCKIYFCDTCADKRDETKQGNASLIHPHNLVYISVKNGEGLKGIEEFRFGTNIQHSTNIQDFIAGCNACQKSVSGGPRFICLNCRPGPSLPHGSLDICSSCMSNWRKKPRDSEENIKFSESLSKNLHDSDSHVFLRIYYGNSYSEF